MSRGRAERARKKDARNARGRRSRGTRAEDGCAECARKEVARNARGRRMRGTRAEGGRAERARKEDARNARGRRSCGTRAERGCAERARKEDARHTRRERRPDPRCTKRRPRRRVTVESPGGKRWPPAAPGLCPPPARDRTQRRDYATAGPARTGIPAAERHIIPQLSHVEQINCYVASDMASQPNSLSENVRRLCRRGDWRTEQRWRLSCRHRSGVSRFGATGRKPMGE